MAKYRPGLLHVDFSPPLSRVEMNIAQLEEDIRDTTGLLTAVIPIAQEDIEQRFKTQTDAGGAKWKPWSTSYTLEKKRTGPILTQDGNLRRDAADIQNFVVAGKTLSYSPPLTSYGLAHEEGLPHRKNPLPQRSFSPWSTSGAAKVAALSVRWMNSNLTAFRNRGKIIMRHRDPKSGEFYKP